MLDHFLAAQATVHETALAELAAGRKRSHWMWFIFPQIEGLGTSEMSRRYALHSLDEARAYLAHPVLGERLRECTRAMLKHSDRSARQILGSPDDMKFHSSMTLFHRAAPDDKLFADALTAFFDGMEDAATLTRL
ncbi:DUF1810 domain-containing protein [Rhizobium sp. PAMB 3182]